MPILPLKKGGREGFPVRPFYNAEVMRGQQFRLGVQTPHAGDVRAIHELPPAVVLRAGHSLRQIRDEKNRGTKRRALRD
jgi:hypothetical protein